jgi:hypothetical protein
MSTETKPKTYAWLMPTHGPGQFHWQIVGGLSLMACGKRLIARRIIYLPGRPVSATCAACLAKWQEEQEA